MSAAKSKLVRYPLEYNPIIDYYNKIESGEEVVSKKVAIVYKKLVQDIHDQDSEYMYSPHRANHAIEFIENFCKHSKGEWAGRKIELELWQKAMLAASFGFIHKIDETRKYREILLIVARKNGKSTLASGIGLYLQIADGEGGAEIYAVATKRDQAKMVWDEAKKMVKKSPALLKRIKPLVAELKSDFNDSTFKALGSDSNTLDGLNVHGGMLDEIHAWTDKNLYDVIVDGCSARTQPMIFMITTAGTIRESVYDEKYDEAEMVINDLFNDSEGAYKDETFLPIIYELDDRKEWTEPKAWKKANPALGTVKKVDNLAQKVNRAKANSKLVSNLLTKDFNVPSTSSEAWLTLEQVINKATFDLAELKPNYGIGGVDLSKTTDLTAAKMLFKLPEDEQIYVAQMYWLPEDLLELRSAEDNIPYNRWYEMGLLRTCQGKEIDPADVTEWFLELKEEFDLYPYKIGYDSWSATYWVKEMKDHFGESVMVPVIQGKKTLSGPMYSLEKQLEANLVNYNNNPIDKWCLSNTYIEIDKNQNIQPTKKNNMRRRIDGTAALLNAYVVLLDNKTDYENLV
jgi:phage terminase large subunit-like protein